VYPLHELCKQVSCLKCRGKYYAILYKVNIVITTPHVSLCLFCSLGHDLSGQRNVNIRVTGTPRTPRTGGVAELTCVVTGGSRSAISWTRYGGRLPPSAQPLNDKLKFNSLRPEDGGIYVCTVTTPTGVFEETYTLTVQSRSYTLTMSSFELGHLVTLGLLRLYCFR